MRKDSRFDPRLHRKTTDKTVSEDRTDNKIVGKEIANNSILTNHLANGIITAEKISSDWPVFAGSFSSYTTSTPNYLPFLNSTINIGFTLDSTNSKLTILTSGYYYVSAHQLANTTGDVYLHIRKTATTIVYAYSNNDSTYDLVANALIYCNVGDYIDFYYGGTTTYTWAAPHSSVSCYLIRP